MYFYLFCYFVYIERILTAKAAQFKGNSSVSQSKSTSNKGGWAKTPNIEDESDQQDGASAQNPEESTDKSNNNIMTYHEIIRAAIDNSW